MSTGKIYFKITFIYPESVFEGRIVIDVSEVLGLRDPDPGLALAGEVDLGVSLPFVSKVPELANEVGAGVDGDGSEGEEHAGNGSA